VPPSRNSFDWLPLALVPLLALLALPLIGSPSTWLTLTVAGLAMGMMIFVTASGLTLVFGLMDVLNFGHGVFIAFGAYVATTVFAGMADWTSVDSLLGATSSRCSPLWRRRWRWPAPSAGPSNA
jgi:branched-chain amino acid transport system permease protein